MRDLLTTQRFKVDVRAGINSTFPQGSGYREAGMNVGKISNVGRPAPSLARRAGVSILQRIDSVVHLRTSTSL
jgi:hypothetical protein